MAGNANDWRNEPDLRKRVFHIIYAKLTKCLPQYGHNEIAQMAGKMEEKIYGSAKDKDDYAWKIEAELNLIEEKCKMMQSSSSVNATNTQDSGSQLVLNPGQSFPIQTPTSQQWLPQQNINLSAASQRQQLLPPQQTMPGSQSGQSVPTQTPTSQQWLPQQNINLSAASQRQQLLPPQQTMPGSQSGQSVPTQTTTSQQWLPQQNITNSQRQQLLTIIAQNLKIEEMLKELIRRGNMQQQAQQHLQSLLKQRIHQSLPSAANHNSQLVPCQNIGEQQGAFRPSYQAIAPQNNLQTMHQQPQRMPGSQSAAQDYKGKGVVIDSGGGDWQEETYQRIKALKEKHLSILTHMLLKYWEMLQQPESLPPQMMQSGFTESLSRNILLIEQVRDFLQLHKSSISEMHRDMFSLYEEKILIITEGPMQQQQEQFPPSQTNQTVLQSQLNVLQSLEKDQMISRLTPSNQDRDLTSVSGLMTSQTSVPHSFQTWPRFEPRDGNNTLASSRNVVLPSIKQNPPSNPQVVHSNINPIQSSMLQQMHQPAFQSKQQTKQENQQFQMMTSKQGVNYSSNQGQLLNEVASGSALSTQLVDQQILPATVNKTAIPSQSIGSPFVGPSPVTSLKPSPVSHSQSPSSYGVEIKSTLDSSVKSSTQEQPRMPIYEQPTDRLIKAFQSSSPQSCQSVGGSRVRSREDLSGSTNPNKRMKRSINAIPLENSLDSEVNKIGSNCLLIDEIKEINSKLVDTMVEICNEDVKSGTIIMCSYTPVDFNGQILQIQPLRLLVPANYPNCSPTLLDEIPFDANSDNNEDLSARTRSRFSLSLKELSKLVSLKQIAQAWNDSAKATMDEYATRHGYST